MCVCAELQADGDDASAGQERERERARARARERLYEESVSRTRVLGAARWQWGRLLGERESGAVEKMGESESGVVFVCARNTNPISEYTPPLLS